MLHKRLSSKTTQWTQKSKNYQHKVFINKGVSFEFFHNTKALVLLCMIVSDFFLFALPNDNFFLIGGYLMMLKLQRHDSAVPSDYNVAKDSSKGQAFESLAS